MKRMTGWTLVDVMTVLWILGLMLGYGVPWASELVESQRWRSAVAHAYTAVLYARSEALAGNMMLTVCPTDDGQQCGRDWHGRWLMFRDQNQNGQVDSGDRVVREVDSMRIQGAITWRSFRNVPYMQFTNEGYASSSNGTLLFCDQEARPGWDRKVIISRSGRPRIEAAPPNGELDACVGRR